MRTEESNSFPPVEEPVVAFISPLRNNKGLDQVVRAMERVVTAVPAARLVIAGSGEDELSRSVLVSTALVCSVSHDSP